MQSLKTKRGAGAGKGRADVELQRRPERFARFQDKANATSGRQLMRKMTVDQIPEFVRDVAATGCDIRAVGDDAYVIADADLPDDVYQAIEPELDRISEKYGRRDHLRLQIAAYLLSIGRVDPPHRLH